VIDITPVWHFSITQSGLVRSINHNVMLLQQLLSDLKRVLHLSAGQCPGTQTASGSHLFPHIFTKCAAILKIFQNRLGSKYVIKQWSTVPPNLSHIATLWCGVFYGVVYCWIIIHVSGCTHQPIPLLSPRGKCTGPADGLRAGVQSRLGSCPKRTNERTFYIGGRASPGRILIEFRTWGTLHASRSTAHGAQVV